VIWDGYGAGRVPALGPVETQSYIVLVILTNSDRSSTPDKHPIKTQAGLTDSAVVIPNLNNFPWPAVTVYLNGNPLDGYRAGPYGPIAPNQDLRIPFTKFVKGDLRFNVYERKVNR
jgi:hypothetical protein